MLWCCLKTLVFNGSILVIPLLLLWLLYRRKQALQRVCVVVLGDIGRSPRTQYHSLSFAKAGFDVDIVGFGGSPPIAELLQNDKVHIHNLKDPPKQPHGLPTVVFYILKTLFQSLQLLFVLLIRTNKSGFVLAQNPPSIPSLAVLWLLCMLRGSQLVIDWHNYGYTILALNLKSQRHPLVRFSKWYEGFFGRMALHNFCVTNAMKDDLWKQWRIRATVLYDRPSSRFQVTDLQQQHQLFLKLSKHYAEFASKTSDDENVSSSTRFTNMLLDGSVQERSDRPCLLVSSTSWTEDEDFSILLDALRDYESSFEDDGDSQLPDVLCVITGKGPLKEHYKNLISQINFKHLKVCTPWLQAVDYPLLLGSANLGVCLHTSSSGLDLPMKVVDMFGCRLPVCAINFKCLDELVQDNVNGLVFNNGKELVHQLKDLLRGFPDDQEKLTQFRENIEEFNTVGWDESWNGTVLPVITASTS